MVWLECTPDGLIKILLNYSRFLLLHLQSKIYSTILIHTSFQLPSIVFTVWDFYFVSFAIIVIIRSVSTNDQQKPLLIMVINNNDWDFLFIQGVKNERTSAFVALSSLDIRNSLLN